MSTSSAPPPRPPPPAHTRTYQACIPCRRRKVRCDLGPVDNPHDPPCVRCRRESKDCYFSATRRKKRNDELGKDEDDGDISDYEIRNGRKRPRLGSSGGDASPPSGLHHPGSLHVNSQLSPTSPHAPLSATAASGNMPPQPLTPGGSIGRYQPLRRPNAQPAASSDEEDQKVNNATAAILQTAEVYSGHDALNLLFEAATGRGDDIRHQRTGSNSSVQRSVSNNANTPSSQAAFASPQASGMRYQFPARSVPDSAVDPAISQPFPNSGMAAGDPAYEQALRAWSRFRFVRAGWLTAHEAMDYVQYFREYLSPLTPIVIPDFGDYSRHAKFLTEEPMLVVTLLTIASRYMKLTGPGASSRPYAIHEKLWRYLQGMIERMIWGQEQFGGGFSGAGAQPGADVDPLTRKGLRTLGTVESLILLTEWHPRALHFPPGDDDDELMAPEDNFSNYNAAGTRSGDTGERVNNWLEPCWRSDRMCWMLLGNAVSLAFEIGVFDEDDIAGFQENLAHDERATRAYLRRRNVLRDLLLIYVTQTSGRLGLTSMLPSDAKDPAFGRRSDPRQQDRLTNLRNANRAEKERIGRGQFAAHDASSMQDRVLYFWKEMAYFFEAGNLRLFPNRRITRELIKTGQYVEHLKYFNAVHQEWRADFEKSGIPEHMRHILMIEYEYSRVYVNGLALQAVVERCTNNTPAQTHAQPTTEYPGVASSASTKGAGGISGATLMKWYGEDRPYIWEVIDACRNVLRIVVEGLYPGEYLKHAPVRTVFRIISVSIILLKTFALGATEDDVAISLGLLDQAVQALRTCIVDDVHIANNFADLCEKLTQRIRTRFVRLAVGGANGSTGVSRVGSPGGGPPASYSGNPATAAGPGMGVAAASMGPPQHPPGQQPQGMQGGWPGPGYSGVLPSSNPDSPSLTTGGRVTPSGAHASALWGISTEAYDPGRSDVSIMPPPPSFGYGNMAGQYEGGNPANPGGDFGSGGFMAGTGTGAATGGGGGDNAGEEANALGDWLALPLDPLLNSYGADVTQTTYGPDIGGFDMLDLLLSGMNDPAGGSSGN